jgi:hypothetical protein
MGPPPSDDVKIGKLISCFMLCSVGLLLLEKEIISKVARTYIALAHDFFHSCSDVKQ